MNLHHRVRITSWTVLGHRRWSWTCPGCWWAGLAYLGHGDALTDAHRHAFGCDKLRELNRATAWGCRNCDGTGIVSGLDCLACLGRGWLA